MNSDKLINTIDISHYMIDQESINLVIPGDLITSEDGFMHGHGTYKMGQSIYASLMGTVEITNKLIIVNPIKSKYSPQVGDIVVGKVIEISNKRWKVDINASFYGYLNLNAAYMTEQRKKNQQDQFNMRKIMEEGDIIVAEVQSANNDKTVNLHTRNPKYGKLQPGVFLEVPHKLVKKQKHHMIYLNEVGIIMGNNGNIWLSGFNRIAKETDLKEMQKNKRIKDGEIPAEVFSQISILHNLIKLLSWEGLEISQILLKQITQFIEEEEIKSSDILSKEGKVKSFILEQIRERIPKRLEELSQNINRN